LRLTEQEITIIDMREASQQDIMALAESLLDASRILSLQGFRLEISSKPTCKDHAFCRFCDFSKNCNDL
jgi:hypothetical protein